MTYGVNGVADLDKLNVGKYGNQAWAFTSIVFRWLTGFLLSPKLDLMTQHPPCRSAFAQPVADVVKNLIL